MRGVNILFFALMFSFSPLLGQSDAVQETMTPIDIPTTKAHKEHKEHKEHSPKKAGWYSTALPGLGQAYNKKYWKIPIVWAGFAATGHFIGSNAVPMQKERAAYIWLSKEDPEGEAPELAIKNPNAQNHFNSYNQYRHNVELFAIISIAWYALNVLDAVVDAHLMYFDVSDDLSFNISPFVVPVQMYNSNTFATGIAIKINF